MSRLDDFAAGILAIWPTASVVSLENGRRHGPIGIYPATSGPRFKLAFDDHQDLDITRQGVRKAQSLVEEYAPDLGLDKAEKDGPAFVFSVKEVRVVTDEDGYLVEGFSHPAFPGQNGWP